MAVAVLRSPDGRVRPIWRFLIAAVIFIACEFTVVRLLRPTVMISAASIAALAIIIATDGGIGDRNAPPIEELNVQRVTLPKPGEIKVQVVNDGPDDITIAQVQVDGAYWSFSQEPAGTLSRLESATITIPYPWVQDETHAIALVSSSGVLFDAETPPKRLKAAVTSRIKIMAELNIAERRLPQDGRIRMNLQGRRMDIRVSTIPTVHGESVVMRILDRASILLPFEKLGFDARTQRHIDRLINLPHGMMLVTGPTGSGKTTTLYAALDKINAPGKKIITIEDPVEYMLLGVNQIHVKPKIGLTFAAGLRHIVRQDPDVIMVGEIRDLETADIGIHAAHDIAEVAPLVRDLYRRVPAAGRLWLLLGFSVLLPDTPAAWAPWAWMICITSRIAVPAVITSSTIITRPASGAPTRVPPSP